MHGEQDAKDIGRDNILFNGNFYAGADIGYEGIVKRVAGLVGERTARVLLSCLNRFTCQIGNKSNKMEEISSVFGKNVSEVGKSCKFDTNVKNRIFPIFKS